MVAKAFHHQAHKFATQTQKTIFSKTNSQYTPQGISNKSKVRRICCGLITNHDTGKDKATQSLTFNFLFPSVSRIKHDDGNQQERYGSRPPRSCGGGQGFAATHQTSGAKSSSTGSHWVWTYNSPPANETHIGMKSYLS